MTDKPQADLVPNSVEAEEAVLGAILLDHHALLDVKHFLRPDDFFLQRNAWVFEAMLRIYERGDSIDYLSVMTELRAMGRLEAVGGTPYVTHLLNNTPTSLYAGTYGRIVQRAGIRRRLLDAASKISRAAYDQQIDVDAALDQSRAAVNAVVNLRSAEHDDRMAAVGVRTRDALAQMITNRGQDRITTGIVDLDAQLGGLLPDTLTIIGGRPGMGKTSMIITILMHAARCGKRVGLFSLEMRETEVNNRMIAQVTGLNMQKMSSGNMTDDEIIQYMEVSERMDALPVYIDDRGKLTLPALEAKATRWHNGDGLDLLIVDYVQLMVGNARAENRVQEVGEISRGLKQLARTLHIPVIAAAQLNRKVEERQDKRPILADLRESGDLEQDADVVMFLYRDDYYHKPSERPNQVDAIIAKHRNGPTGIVPMFFRAERMQMANLKRETVNFAAYDAENSPGGAA